MNALLQCVDDPKVFCRVRADAARALGACACDASQRSNLALTSVARAYRRRRCDPSTGLPAPTDLSNLATAVVDEGLVAALGLPRSPPEPTGGGGGGATAGGVAGGGTGGSARWVTPSECVELLTDMLDYIGADGDPHDSTSLVAAGLAALGNTRPPTTAALEGAVDAIRRWLRHDAVICGVGGSTHAGGRRVTIAALHALRALVGRLPSLPAVLAAAAAAKRSKIQKKKRLRRLRLPTGGPGSGIDIDGDASAAAAADAAEEEEARWAHAEEAARAVAGCVAECRRAVSDAVGDPCQAYTLNPKP